MATIMTSHIMNISMSVAGAHGDMVMLACIDMAKSAYQARTDSNPSDIVIEVTPRFECDVAFIRTLGPAKLSR